MSFSKGRLLAEQVDDKGTPIALEVKHLTLAHVGTEGNEQADQAAKEGAAGESHMKETQTPIPWQAAKSKIEEYTTSKWK